MTAFAEYIGRTDTRQDVADERRIAGLAATLGVPVPAHVLPPLWHWMFFQDWVEPAGIGPDGHPRRGGFLPPIHHLPRRMWAGGRLTFHAPLRPGEALTRTSTIQSVTPKSGASGEMVFVTVQHRVSNAAGLALTEEQDIVYRGANTAAVKPGAPAAPVPFEVEHSVTPGPVLLFRYSALTGNGHRIHYDADYVRDVEGYPGLVVHGPLQATWLAALAPGPVARFSFRGLRPAFHDRPLRLEGWQDGAVFRARTCDADGAVCMAAEALMEMP